MFSMFKACFRMNSSSCSPLGSVWFGVGPHMLLCALESVPISIAYLFVLQYCIIWSSQGGVTGCLLCRYMLEITVFCPFMLPAMVVQYCVLREGRRLKLSDLLMYIAVRGCLCCSSLVHP